ncbi:MAG TPA: transcriptional repressor LexA [Kiritimatiellia bacterium]|nr:transcriptional repressor LexA [Kiritimatiellia bacterium]
MEILTPKQKQILDYISRYFLKNRMAPTVREIADSFGFRSPKAVSDHLEALERKGYLTRTTGIARGIRLVEELQESRDRDSSIPIVGDVAAGLPILAIENVLGTLSMDSTFGAGELFAVRVRGDSMIDHGIYDGDFVVVRRSPHVDNNAIAVAYVNGESTVKVFHKTECGYTLIPGNSKYPPIEINPETDEFSVAGPVVGVVRAM